MIDWLLKTTPDFWSAVFTFGLLAVAGITAIIGLRGLRTANETLRLEAAPYLVVSVAPLTSKVEASEDYVIFMRFRDALEFRFAKAVRLAWRGEFRQGYDLLDGILGENPQRSVQRLHHARTALFAVLADRPKDAAALLKACASSGSAEGEWWRYFDRSADICAALAEVFLGRSASARRRLPVGIRKREIALVRAVRGLAALNEHLTPETVLPVVQELMDAEQEGLANLISAAASKGTAPNATLALTPTEIAIFRSLAEGLAPKVIAAESGRSVDTVRNHIKSAIRKMGVSGQREALALARRLGVI